MLVAQLALLLIWKEGLREVWEQEEFNVSKHTMLIVLQYHSYVK